MEPIKTLAFDTSTQRGSIALLEGNEIRGELHVHSLETHSARLLASTEFLLRTLDWDLSGIGLVAAGIGPGSFTGIRIGVATALGLAQTLGVPFAGISGLDALAQNLAGIDGRIGAVMDAQRNQVYCAEYTAAQGKIKKAGKAALWKPAELAAQFSKRRILLIGDGAIRYRDAFTGRGDWPRVVETDLFLAGSMGRLALTRRRHWRTGEYLFPNPLYIRPPDAFKGKGKRR